MAAPKLDLADIQGGILRAYGRLGFPKARYMFFNVREPAKGRAFVEAVRPRITTAAKWVNRNRGPALLRGHHPRLDDVIRNSGVDDYPGVPRFEKPKVAINIAFSFLGLLALDVPTRTLRGMPDEFMDGMEARAAMLGDTPFLDKRDAIWRGAQGDRAVHIFISLNGEMDDAGQPVPELEDETNWLRQLCEASEGGVAMLRGNGPTDADYQSCSAVLVTEDGKATPTNKEHFQLSDGFGDPVFEGQYGPKAGKIKMIGGGKLLPDQSWAPLATGEFLLGYPDEAQEIPPAGMPLPFSRNGTFMAYRKLHENVVSFGDYTTAQGALYGAAEGIADPEDAVAALKAKLVGRWPDGVPLMAAPTVEAWHAFNAELAAAKAAGDKVKLAAMALQYVNFVYRGDPGGATCPVASHLRRANTRDMLDPYFDSTDPKQWMGSVLNNRRRILRRGLPYGEVGPDATDAGEHGIIFMAVCANLFRQFEFLQQQWIQYGLDFNVGSDTCPVVGNHGPDKPVDYVIPVDPNGDGAPFICKGVPQFVEPRGGEYFFIPSMNALRMIAMGIVDPT
jgi:deferrochelatase/peroxidase EfeB